jgi:dolichol-phosphate mannosyltransferase
MRHGDVLIVIPAYNEESTIEEVVTRAKKYADVCVVNDCSNDATPQILAHIDNIHVIDHYKNTHIPGAIIDGMRYAKENGYKFVITLDAGLSHNPDEIPLFMGYPYTDLLIGSRKKKLNVPLYRRMLSFVGNCIYNISLDFPKNIFKKIYYKDISSGYRRYSNKAVNLLLSKRIESKSFDFLIESLMYIYKEKLTISELPITYIFSNSSLNLSVIKDCMTMCLKLILRQSKI